jgi:hypothetical protein
MAGTTNYVRLEGKTLERLHINMIADAADGSFAEVEIPNISGFLVNVYVKPGSPTPTNLIDLSVALDSINLLGTAGDDIATSANAIIVPQNTLGDPYLPGFYPSLTIGVTGNSVNSAELDIYLIISKAK